MGRFGQRSVLLGAVVIVSSALVIGAFDPSPHTGGDNSGYVALAYGMLTTGSYVEVFDPAGLPHTKYPPLFPAILAVLMWLGARTWVALKTVAAVSTVVGVGFTYLWAERRLGPWPAFGVALLFATSMAVVYYSHWILSDPVFVAFTMAALWALDRDDEEGAGAGWVGVGVALAGLAYFTRSAGLPLVAAALAWLALRKRWRTLGVASVALGIPAVAWFARGFGQPASYTSEFWMVDPYDPGMGTVGLVGLAGRGLSNLTAYVLDWGPTGIIGSSGTAAQLMGVSLTVTAAYGWLASAKVRLRPAELFLPAYVALILLWPEVWGGDRFALPLYPLVLGYAAVALQGASTRVPLLLRQVGAVGVIAVVLVPSTLAWSAQARRASTCAGLVRTGGAFACAGPRVGAFVAAAEWSGRSLPGGSAVMSRKPRHFYALSGVPSRTFPFVADPEAQLSAADEVGARYVLLDQWDGQATRFVAPALAARPGAYCFVQSFGDPRAGGSDLLGVLPERSRADGRADSSTQIRLAVCPPGYGRADASRAYSASASGRIPLLDGLDP